MSRHASRKKSLHTTPLSVLDLSPIKTGGTVADAFHRSLDLAQHVEHWGFHRYWLAEHHNMAGIASAATSVLIGYIAGGTSTIRVGSGGVMLPNHAPLVIAEQFGTLDALYPGRIDLGLGRAPGTDMATVHALRRDARGHGRDFPELLEELRGYLAPAANDAAAAFSVRAVPGEGANLPIWLLGSSDFSAQLAGYLGLPFAFAGQFAAENLHMALDAYRHSFRPSPVLDAPYAMVGVNVLAADSDEQAQFLATTQQQKFLQLLRGHAHRSQMAPPVTNMDEIWTPQEKAALTSRIKWSIIGSPTVVREKLVAFVEDTQADELIINSEAFDHSERLHSFEIVAHVAQS